MLWILLIVVLGVVAYRYRVKILARVLGQPERRIERQIGRKKRRTPDRARCGRRTTECRRRP